ncbi:YitT family protein [Paenibacillus sp. MER 99-2]|uniref:YitT family protein n=1 Tax=Paenibacillus sp. MER 99-2 TaxID=2939572 RepID=UPI00203BF5B1|nr:YitT family protein [Paenibacillus sp. MER 99-2]MCM3173176.1 YitT family protein [Paenibacillus sp. MER 99-2]
MKAPLISANPAPQTTKTRISSSRRLLNLLLVIAGGILASVGLELFLHPNKIIIGGITGISSLFAHWTEMRIGLFLFLFNVPFIFLSYKIVQKKFVLVTVLGLVVFSIGAIVLHPMPPLVEHPLAAAMFGGLCLGIGIGLVVRYGGTLDTLEIGDPSSRPPERLFSGKRMLIEKIIMLLNLLILTAAGVVFGWDQAMYSVIAYLIAYEMVYVAFRGFSAKRKVYILTAQRDQVTQALRKRLRREPVTSNPSSHSIQSAASDGWVQHFPGALYYEVHFLEMIWLKSIVRHIDPHAGLVTNPEK